MDIDKAGQILNIRVGDKVSYLTDIVKKSFYEFDLNSVDGITSFLTVLPITSDELLMQACSEVFPGYNTDEFDVKLARLELRGYFLDFLRQQELNPEMPMPEEQDELEQPQEEEESLDG